MSFVKNRYRLKKIYPAVKPGLFFVLLALLYTVIFNVTLSYMGNSAANSLSMVLNNFLFYLIAAVLKLVAFYTVLYSLLSAFFYFGLSGICSLFNVSPGRRKHFVSVVILIFVFYLLQLCRSMINYPQMYIDSFYVKNSFYASFQEFLTTHAAPVFFSVPQILIALLFSAGAAVEFYRRNRDLVKKLLKPSVLRTVSAVVVLASSVFFIADYFLLNRTPSDRKNIIIIASDALRPDHFSGSGYRFDTTPDIDAFIRESLSASDINTVTPRTFPSWVTILTSQYPQTHTIRNMFPSSANRNREFVSLATILRDMGYETSVVGDFAADIFPRIDLGFKNVITPTFNSSVMLEQILLKFNIFVTPFITNRAGMSIFPSIREFAEFADPSYVVDDILSQVDSGRRAGKPFFITSFFSVTHFPFSSPWPYYKRYTDPSYSGPSKYLKNRMLSLGKKGGGGEATDLKEAEHVRALYDGCLRAFNDSFAQILQHLEKRGLADNTVVVLLSDHGENLYEYDNGMGHGEHLRGHWSLRVPFAVRAKGVEPRVITGTGSLVDVAPTICDIMNIKSPGTFEGRSILKPVPRRFDAYTETGLWFDTSGDYFFQKKRIMYPDITGFSAIEFDYNGEVCVSHDYRNLTDIAKHRAVKSGDFKLIYMPTQHGIEYELYNTKKDPDERDNIFLSDRESAGRLKKILFDFAAEDSGAAEVNGYIIPLFNEPVF